MSQAVRPRIKIEYRITREGVIKIPKSLACSNQCVAKGWSKYFYKCCITTDNKKLDNNGFIIDHNDINNQVTHCLTEDKYTGSCELISEYIIGAVVRMLNEKSYRFKSVELTLMGKKIDNPAFITAMYTNKKFN